MVFEKKSGQRGFYGLRFTYKIRQYEFTLVIFPVGLEESSSETQRPVFPRRRSWQTYGVSLVWIFKCLLRFDLILKHFLQTPHRNGFTPLCTRSCTWWLKVFLNHFLQILHSTAFCRWYGFSKSLPGDMCSLRNMFCFDTEHICSVKIETFCFGLREKKFSKVEHFSHPCLGIELINICFISVYFPRPYSAKDELNGRFPRLSPYLSSHTSHPYPIQGT